jgi:radical SAM protein with 4Fe4S-binding SPASM domain
MKFLKSLVGDYKFWRQKRKAAQRPILHSGPYVVCNIELTNNCPMKCVMCPRTKHMTRAVGYMDLAVFKKVIDQMVADNPAHADGTTVALHHFGESLMHRGFGEFVRYAEDKGVRTDLSVNPIVFTPRVIEQLLESPPTVLHISLDGHDDESFRAIRGVRNAYGRSKAKFLSYLEAKRARNVETRVVVNMIAFDMNQESIARQTEFWNSLRGVDEFSAKDFITWTGDAEEINALRAGQRNSLSDPLLPHFVSCNRPWQVMTITWDGDVVPCCYDYDKKEVIGNVRHQSLMEIWNGKPMQELRRQFVTGQVTSKLCESCEYLLRIR